MIYILEAFREKHIRKLLLAMMGFGFFFVFFYQVLVLSDFLKVSFKVNLAGQAIDTRVYLLSGWTTRENRNNKDAIWSKEKSSTVAIFFPKKSSYRIKLSLLSFERGLIRIYVNKELVTTLKPAEIGKWQDFKFIVPYNLISEGFNKIGFINLSENRTPVGYKDLSVTNYQRMPLAFPSGYVLFQKVRWLSRGGGLRVNWLFCIFGGLILSLFWVVYSAWFFSLSKTEFSKILRLDFFTYLPCIIILMAIYLSSRIFVYSPIFTRRDFLLFSIGLVSCSKAYQFYRYAQKFKIKAQINFFKDIITAQITGSIFIIGFMVLLVICTFFLIIKQENIAERVANWAYLVLVSGVVSRLVGFLNKERIFQENSVDSIIYNKMHQLSKSVMIILANYFKIIVKRLNLISLVCITSFLILLLISLELSIIYKNRIMAVRFANCANILLITGIIIKLVRFFTRCKDVF